MLQCLRTVDAEDEDALEWELAAEEQHSRLSHGRLRSEALAQFAPVLSPASALSPVFVS